MSFKEILAKKEEGFTLIEIVFVLAIAALIIVIVFLAVAGARNSAKDTASKDWAGRLAAACDKWASEQAGALAGDTTKCTTNAAAVALVAGTQPAQAATATINATDVTVTLTDATVFHATF